MQTVYVLERESYEYWDNEFSTSYEVFTDKTSAENYLAMLKSSLFDDIARALDDWLDAENKGTVKTWDDVKRVTDPDGLDFYYTDREDYFTIHIEEWGSETLSIIKKDIMTFN